VLAKNVPGEHKTNEQLDHAIRQIISKAMVSDEVIDIFAAAGLRKPDIWILSDEFLAEVRGMPQRNLAVELLQKLLKGEIRLRARRNLVQARSFSEMLENSLRRYQNRAIETAKVIEELIQLAKDMRQAAQRGVALGLNDDEVAFYDALESNDSAVKVLGDDALRTIARELVATVRANVTIDWTVRENVRAQLRVLVKRILRKHGYPPDKQEKATQTGRSRRNCSQRDGSGGPRICASGDAHRGAVARRIQSRHRRPHRNDLALAGAGFLAAVLSPQRHHGAAPLQ
jgi:type I restriction enzyme R subunit